MQGLESLTQRERAVADAARTGASTRAIADLLFISTRTVETHLGAIYRKLGVAHRAELVARLHRVDAGAVDSAPAVAQLPLPAGLVAPTRFVGRETERETVSAALQVVRTGESATVMIGGEPGVGKSALVAGAAAQAHADGVLILCGGCRQDFKAPYLPIAGALRPYLVAQGEALAHAAGAGSGALASVWPELIAHLPAAPLVQDAATGRRVLVDAISDVLARAARPSSLVLVLEDLHWADEATLSLLRHLIHVRLPGVLVLGTFRSTELVREHPLPGLLASLWREPSVRRCDLDGLGSDDTLALARAEATVPLDDRDLRGIHPRTSGNPFFVLQLVRHVQDPASPLSVPGGVREVVLDRARSLGADAVRVLEAAAILGSDFHSHALRETLVLATTHGAADELSTHLSRATTAGLVVESSDGSGRYRFVHELVREAVLEQLTGLAGARLHRAAGYAIQEVFAADLAPHFAALANHFAAAASLGEGLLAAQFALGAAQQAMERLAPDDALAVARAGRRCLPTGVQHDQLRLDLMQVEVDVQATRMDLAAHREAILAAVAIARRLGDPAALARTVDRNTVLPAMGTLDEELLAAKWEAIAALGAEPSALRTRLLVSATYQRTIGGHGWAAAGMALGAVAEARSIEDQDGIIAGLYALTAATLGRPDVAEQLAVAQELTLRGQQREGRLPEQDGRRFRGLLLLMTGDREGFERDAAQLAALAATTGSVFLQSLVAEWRVALALLDGDLQRAEDLANAVLEVSGDDPNFLLGWLAQLAWIRIQQDRASEMLALADSTVSDHPDLAAVRALAANLHAASGDLVAATELARPLLAAGGAALPSDWLRPATLGYLAPVARDCFGAGECLALAELLAPYSGQLLTVGAGALVLGAADYFRGMLLAAADGDAAEPAPQVLAAAIDLSERVGGTLLAAHSRIELAAALQRRDPRGPGEIASSLLEAARAEGLRRNAPRVIRLAG